MIDFTAIISSCKFGQISITEANKMINEQLALTTQLKPRPAVQWFANQMEVKLKLNDHKCGWQYCELQYLSMRLTQERKELTAAIESKEPAKVISECADISNFAMMIADRFGPEFGK